MLAMKITTFKIMEMVMIGMVMYSIYVHTGVVAFTAKEFFIIVQECCKSFQKNLKILRYIRVD